MSGILFRKGSSQAPEIAGFRVQSSIYGLPIPIVYGTARVAGNLIDFVPGPITAVETKPSKWVDSTQTGWQYVNAVALGLCEGVIAGIGYVWRDKDERKDFDTFVQPDELWDLKLGTIAPSALGYLSSVAPYQYLAYVAVESLSMPSNALPNLSWEVQGLFIFGGGIVDALPSDVLEDLLTNPTHGTAFPAASLDSLADYADYCAAAGLFVSPALTSIRKGADVIDELMIATNSAVVWSDGLLKVKPYGDEPLSGNGHTYTPNTTPIYDLNDQHYMAGEGEDPVVVRRKNPNDCFNQLFLEFENRGTLLAPADYNPSVREAKNDDDILINGLRPGPKLSIPMIKDPDVARTVVQLQQQREQFVANEYLFRLGWKFSLLEPMDLVTLTDETLGLDFTPVRITQVIELEDAEGIDFVAEDWPFGAATATLYPSEDGDGHKPKNNVAPGDTTTPVIFNGPLSLTNESLEIWIAASGGQYWGGCEVWISADGGVTYRKAGTIRSKATFGELTADLDEGDAYPLLDSVNTLSVDVTASGGSLEDQSQEDFDALVPLCYVDGEFLAFRDATLTSPFCYDLDTLYRALHGSVQTATPGHLSGSAFAFIDDSIFRLGYPQGFGGQTLYFKFPAFNVYGNALQSLASVSPVTFVIQSPIGAPEITSVTPTPTFSPCDGSGDLDIAWVASGMPVGVVFSVRVDITSGIYTGTYGFYAITSGSTIHPPLCPGETGICTVTAAVDGTVVATLSAGFTS